MKSFSSVKVFLLLHFLAPGLTAQTFIPHPPKPPQYVVLDVRRISILRQELALTAMKGYRAVLVAPRPGAGLLPAGMTIIMEKLESGVAAPEYSIAEDKNGNMQHLSVNSGFRYVRNSVFEHRGHDVWGDFIATMIWGEKHVDHSKYDTVTGYMLLEKTKESEAPCAYMFQHADSKKEFRSTRSHLASGFHVVGELNEYLFLEKCSSSAQPLWGPSEEKVSDESIEKYRFVATNDAKKRQKKLVEAVSKGFRLSHANGKWISLFAESSSEAKTNYKVFAARTEAELEQLLNSSSAFRVVPDSLVRKNGFWNGAEYQIVVEEDTEKNTSHQYRVLREKNGQDLQDGINLAAEKGYKVREMRRDAMGITAILERVARSMPAPGALEQIPERTPVELELPEEL